MPAPFKARWRSVSPLEAPMAGSATQPAGPPKGQIFSEAGLVKPSRVWDARLASCSGWPCCCK